jgi:hypothetical protein
MAKPMKAHLLKSTSANEWETTGGFSGFPPTWKPEKLGESVIGVPVDISSFLYGKKKKAKMIHNIQFLLRETNSKSFFTGSKKKKSIKRVDVAIGDIISIPASVKLEGEEALYLDKGEKKKAILSPLSIKLESESVACKVVFNGRIDIGGPNKMKDFMLLIPKGFKAQKGGNKKK